MNARQDRRQTIMEPVACGCLDWIPVKHLYFRLFFCNCINLSARKTLSTELPSRWIRSSISSGLSLFISFAISSLGRSDMGRWTPKTLLQDRVKVRVVCLDIGMICSHLSIFFLENEDPVPRHIGWKKRRMRGQEKTRASNGGSEVDPSRLKPAISPPQTYPWSRSNRHGCRGIWQGSSVET